jgi:hypothetical protein
VGVADREADDLGSQYWWSPTSGVKPAYETSREEEATCDLTGRATTPARLLYTVDPDISA